MDGHMYQQNKKTKNYFHQVGTTLQMLDTGTLWANHAETIHRPLQRSLPQIPTYDIRANGIVGLLHESLISNPKRIPTPTFP